MPNGQVWFTMCRKQMDTTETLLCEILCSELIIKMFFCLFFWVCYSVKVHTHMLDITLVQPYSEQELIINAL